MDSHPSQVELPSELQAHMADWLAQFAAVKDTQELAAFWQQVPLEQEESFIAVVEQAIQAAQAAQDEGRAQSLSQRWRI